MQLLYIIKGRTTRLIKIGIADSPRSRLRIMQCGSPDVLDLIMVIDPKLADLEAIRVEYMLHRFLRGYRKHGEWFTCSPELIDWLSADSHLIAYSNPKRGLLSP